MHKIVANFTDNIFKWIFMNEHLSYFDKIFTKIWKIMVYYHDGMMLIVKYEFKLSSYVKIRLVFIT